MAAEGEGADDEGGAEDRVAGGEDAGGGGHEVGADDEVAAGVGGEGEVGDERAVLDAEEAEGEENEVGLDFELGAGDLAERCAGGPSTENLLPPAANQVATHPPSPPQMPNPIDRSARAEYNPHQSRKGVPLGTHALNRGGKGGRSALSA